VRGYCIGGSFQADDIIILLPLIFGLYSVCLKFAITRVETWIARVIVQIRIVFAFDTSKNTHLLLYNLGKIM
jgi:hypothetical protein